MKASELSQSAQRRIKQMKGRIVIARQRGKAGHELMFISPHNLGGPMLAANDLLDRFERMISQDWKIVERDV